MEKLQFEIENCVKLCLKMTNLSFYLLSFLLLLPIIASLTVVEDVFLNQELLEYFSEDPVDEESSEVSRSLSESKKIASLLSQRIQTRANHYWTRLGHRSRTTPPQYYIGYSYYDYPYNFYNRNRGFSLGKRRKRNVEIFKKRIFKRETETDENANLATDPRDSMKDPSKMAGSHRIQRSL